MERPPSQLENMRPSGLKQPSRLPAMMGSSRTLGEASQSEMNARSAGMMGPPLVPQKHKVPGLPEPPTKQRKTLIERAGETTGSLRSHLPAVSKPGFTRSESNTAQVGSGMKSASFNGYRNTSNASTVSSVSSTRNGSRQIGFRSLRQPSAAESVQEEEEVDDGMLSRRKGTPVISLNPKSIEKITLRKVRTHGDLRQHSQSSDSSVQHSGLKHRHQDLEGRVVSRDDHAGRPSHAQQHTQPNSRQASLSAACADLSLTPQVPRKHSGKGIRHTPSLERIKEEISPSKIPKFSCTPLLHHTQTMQTLSTPSPLKHKGSVNGLRTPAASVSRNKHQLPVFLTKEKLTPVAAWNTADRLDSVEQMYHNLSRDFVNANNSATALEEAVAAYKVQVQEIRERNSELSASNRAFTADLERARSDLHTTTSDLRQAGRDHEREIQDLERRHEKDLAEINSKHVRALQDLERDGQRAVDGLGREIKEAKETVERQKRDEIADLTSQHWEEMDEMKLKHDAEVAKLQAEIDSLRKSDEGRAAQSASQVQALRDGITALEHELEAGKATMTGLRTQISKTASRAAALEAEKAALVSKTHFLEGNQEAQSHEFTTMSEQLAAAVAAREATIVELRREETVRRKLNAQILELRGNIRVFARTRPLLAGEEEPAKVEYPDADSLDGNKELVVHAPTTLSATGKERNEKHTYGFDRVFGPDTANTTVFEDCRELVQSVVDGYNVSILSYGQTGSGKTFGMSGDNGIIPSSIALLLSEIQRLREKGWEYVVEASFVEVYNEMLNDLLGDAKTWDQEEELNGSVRSKKKERHEIHHDALTGKTTVTNLTAVTLWPPPSDDASWPPVAPLASDLATATEVVSAASYTESAVARLLATAAKNRRVAATNSNARSSRSHSAFMLTLKGSCAATGEVSEGVLNLVDLAGSERLKTSGAEGGRMKETQAINKSLSSLGDVIAALAGKGLGGESHVPYRNSKLTYLLQSSLGGTAPNGKSSRTLMLLHLSPLKEHWQESRGSLLFGSKVHGTHIGAAKKK
ncbi:hypothetical protein B0A48_01791 [Cryoendolithus antarcticus]|uniref:Kinesin motor domain-containing protein n=1 Tax=Cryoendolithus antarcticus TaxID=1507870 RepID=A0A1V8TQS8_9PEZI|nr:hypothetical protein B0A48_01791 [Cryoendolithus antarcticus]